MFTSLPVILLSFVATSTFASPTPRAVKTTGCDLSKVKLNLPTNQTQLVAPTTALKFIGAGVGVQNYTCSAGVFASVGAVATLYDASCAASSTLVLDALPEVLFKASQSKQALKILNASPFKLGDHFFITNPITGTGVSPEFNFASSQKTANPFVVAKKTGDIPSNCDPKDDVDWLMLSNVQGSLATTVFRVQTKGGQPATSCTAGQTASVPYAALYYFYA